MNLPTWHNCGAMWFWVDDLDSNLCNGTFTLNLLKNTPYHNPAFYFFPRENQKCAWNVFLAFFWVFSRTKNRFHAHYFATFHGQNNFSRANFRIFSRMDFYLHGKKIDIFENFHVRVSFFHAIKKGPEFQPIEMKFQTRTIFWFLRIEIAISVRYLK